MNENVKLESPNFCTGPQTGTYCSVNVEADPPIMTVKNSIGNIIRNYTFFPSETFNVGPFTSVPTDDDTSHTHGVGEFVDIQYVGPTNADSFFDGASFFTMEKVYNKLRLHYVYDRKYGDYGPYILDEDTGKPFTELEHEYSGNIIRHWQVDIENSMLILLRSYKYTSTLSDWFGGTSFSIKNTVTPLLNHVQIGTGIITVGIDSELLNKYDSLLIGPSNDASNPGKTEMVYIHSVDGDDIVIRSYTTNSPCTYEYLQGDQVTFFHSSYLFSTPMPDIDENEIRDGYCDNKGLLYNLSLYESNVIFCVTKCCSFKDVIASCWTGYLDTLSYVKGTNILHYDVFTNEVKRSQFLNTVRENKVDYFNVFGVFFISTDMYRLQDGYLYNIDDALVDVVWPTLNYVKDSLIPYVASLSTYCDNIILGYNWNTTIKANVRDQFGVGTSNKTVTFYSTVDYLSSFNPAGKQVITDVDGNCTVSYMSGNVLSGLVEIRSSVEGAGSFYGQSSINSSFKTTCVPSSSNSCDLVCVGIYIYASKTLGELLGLSSIDKVMCFVRRYYGWGECVWNSTTNEVDNPKIEDRNKIPLGVTIDLPPALMIVLQPNFNSLDDHGQLIPPITLIDQTHSLYKNGYVEARDGEPPDFPNCYLTLDNDFSNDLYVSQNYTNRHGIDGNIDASKINQYNFIMDSLPLFWSEKNATTTGFWIRLRPFASDLDMTTLSIKFMEVSVHGTVDWYDVTSSGTMTSFDAGSNLMGIFFEYSPINAFNNGAIVYVDISVYDVSASPNKLEVSYWFKIIHDFKAPFIENLVPYRNQYDVASDTEISFDILDVGSAVDITNTELYVSNRKVEFSYTINDDNNISIFYSGNAFRYGEKVNVSVFSFDTSENSNRLVDGWSFSCVASTGPWYDCSNALPVPCSEGHSIKNDNISLQVYAVDYTGIDYNSIKVEVGGKYRDVKITPIIYRIK